MKIKTLTTKFVDSSIQPNMQEGIFYLWNYPYDRYKYMTWHLCPCGCMQTVPLVVSKYSKKTWSIDFSNEKTVTLSPSILLISGCRSHYFIRDGEVIPA